MLNLNYHHLYYFKVIATEGSISKASEHLRVGQPALSAQLKQFEESVGHKLFERKNRRLHITEAGRVVLRYANEIFSLGRELKEVLRDEFLSVQPSLTIGALDSVPKALIANCVLHAQKEQDCRVTILEGSGSLLFSQLLSHEIDVLLSDVPSLGSYEKLIFSKKIASVAVHAFVHPKKAKLKKGFPESLSGNDVILPTLHSKLRHDIEGYMNEKGIQFRMVADTQDTALQKTLAVAGKGVIFEPEFAVKQMIKDKKLTHLGPLEGIREEYFIVSTKRLISNPVVASLMDTFSL